jgi:hypothetical protein
MTIRVTGNKDWSFDISWNVNDPTESMFNTWTEEDFIKALTDYLNKLEEDETTK